MKLYIKNATNALGKPLPKGCHVHHSGRKRNDKKLVICQDAAYHILLHVRTDAKRTSGNANWRKCRKCGEYDDPVNLLFFETQDGYTRATHPPKACKSRHYTPAHIRDADKYQSLQDEIMARRVLLSGGSYSSVGRYFGISCDKMRKLVFEFCKRQLPHDEWLNSKGKPLKLKALRELYVQLR